MQKGKERKREEVIQPEGFIPGRLQSYEDMALANEENMPIFIRCGIMALVAAYLNFLSQMIANPPFCQHVSKVIELRNLDAPYLLPEHIFRDKCPVPESLDKEDRPLYFQTADMAECLAGPGYNAERLSIPYVPQVTDQKPFNDGRDQSMSIKGLINSTVTDQISFLIGAFRPSAESHLFKVHNKVEVFILTGVVRMNTDVFEAAESRRASSGTKYWRKFIALLDQMDVVPRDEDRLTRRKSFVDTISLQVDILSNSLPDKVSFKHTVTQDISDFERFSTRNNNTDVAFL
eukprot:superscaffoldBa00005187_g20022